MVGRNDTSAWATAQTMGSLSSKNNLSQVRSHTKIEAFSLPIVSIYNRANNNSELVHSQIGAFRVKIEDIPAVLQSLADEIKSLKTEIYSLTKRVSSIESAGGPAGRAKKIRPIKVLIDAEASNLFWQCSPKQHALVQMIFIKKTTPSIAARFDVTEGGAKSQIRYLCGRLHVTSKAEIIANYEPIWMRSADQEYFDKAKIPKYWAENFAHFSYKEARKKDKFFKEICLTNYRTSSV